MFDARVIESAKRYARGVTIMEFAKAIIIGSAVRGGIIIGFAIPFLFLIVLVLLLMKIFKVKIPKIPKIKIKKN